MTYRRKIDNLLQTSSDELIQVPSISKDTFVPTVEETNCNTASSWAGKVYSKPLSSTTTVIRIEDISGIDDPVLKEQAVQLEAELVDVVSKLKIDNIFPHASVSLTEGGEIIVEWNFRNFRITFVLNQNKEKSIFYLISKNDDIGTINMQSGKLFNDLHSVVTQLVRYVVANT